MQRESIGEFGAERETERELGIGVIRLWWWSYTLGGKNQGSSQEHWHSRYSIERIQLNTHP